MFEDMLKLIGSVQVFNIFNNEQSCRGELCGNIRRGGGVKTKLPYFG